MSLRAAVSTFVLFLAACALCVPGFAQVALTGKLDVNALVAKGQATLSATNWDIGSPAAIFDGDTSTLYRSANINPAVITVAFTQPRTFDHFAVMAAGGDTRWRIETADTEADLDAHSGSYAILVDWTLTPNETMTTLTPATPGTAPVIRLTANRVTGDNYVHIREWQIFSSVTVTDLKVQPASATIEAGQTQAFTATGTATDGTAPDVTASVTWSSLDTSVATVDATGHAKGVGPGTTTIRATLESLSADAALKVNAAATDLDVLYIARTPKYDFDAVKNNPAPGDPVTFIAHVKNWGGALAGVHYRWVIDSLPVSDGTADFPAFAEKTLSLPWTWESGNHTVGFVVDQDHGVAEVSEANNSRTDRTNAIIAGFWVEQSLYDYFHAHQKDLGIGSNSFEDWIQRQMAKQNALYASAIYPTSPQGVLDRVRIDEITVVPDGALPLHGGLPTNHPDLWDKTVDLMWGFTADGVTSGFYGNTTSTSDTNPFYIEQSLIHELGHARYLIDCYGMDVHNTYNPSTGEGWNSVQIQENGKPVAGTSLMPFLAFNEVLHYNQAGGVMSGPYGFQWSPYEAAALNLIAGKRATCGNYNAPCNIGAYINDLPEHNHIRLVDANGWPLAGADVKVYQAAPGPGWYGKTYDNTPDLAFTTDRDGYAHMPRNPFSADRIVNDYGNANGVMILRIQHPSGLWYRFVEVPDFNMAYWTGHTQDAYYTITLPGATGTPSPADAVRALEIASGLRAPETDEASRLDRDHTGGITTADAALLLRQSMGL